MTPIDHQLTGFKTTSPCPTVVLLDEVGLLVEAPSVGISFDVGWSLNSGSTSSVEFYTSSEACAAGTGAVTSLTFSSGVSMLTFYVKPDAAGDVTITYTNSNPPAGAMEGTNTTGNLVTSPAKPKLISPSGPFVAGTCTGPFYVASIDGNETPVNLSSYTVIHMIASSYSDAGGSVLIFTDSTCTSLYEAGNVSITSGSSSSNNFYLQVRDDLGPAPIGGSADIFFFDPNANLPSTTNLGTNVHLSTVTFQ